jgi:diaminohydroxyphosphoribosylaminopyrimidine deaminase/5-amino-6-(5-phosphoribosylamino)uracil reductase
MHHTNPDKFFLDLAAKLALRARGLAEPNPLVGCVLVKDGHVIGMGHHRRFGSVHAERAALADAADRGHSATGATAYVTLEPCNAQGKNPPCSHALVEARIARVVYACADPNPLKSGGAAFLREQGIECQLSTQSPLASGMAVPFLKRLRTGLPYVIAKWAQTIDGRVATRTGESKWISNEWSRHRVHLLRSRVDAILTGIGTVVTDDPLLNVRLPNHPKPRRRALRVVADTDLDIPADARVVTSAHDWPTLVACDRMLLSAPITTAKLAALQQAGVQILGTHAGPSGRGLDLRHLLSQLSVKHEIATLMTECGPGLMGSLFEEDLVDEAVVYIAPMLLGDEMARSAAAGRVAEHLSQGRRFTLWRTKRLGNDIELTYRRVYRSDPNATSS